MRFSFPGLVTISPYFIWSYDTHFNDFTRSLKTSQKNRRSWARIEGRPASVEAQICPKSGCFFAQTRLPVRLRHLFSRRRQVDRCSLQTPMSHLLLYYRQRDLAVDNICHEVTVPEAVNSEHLQVPTYRVLAVDLLQPGLGDIMLKYLPDTIFCKWPVPTSYGVG